MDRITKRVSGGRFELDGVDYAISETVFLKKDQAGRRDDARASND